MGKIKPCCIPCSLTWSSSTYTLHVCHHRMEQHLGNSWFISSSLMCRKLWISSFTVRSICLWCMCSKQGGEKVKKKKRKNWNFYWSYLGVFSPLILQDTVKRGNNHCSLKWGKKGTEKSKGWLRISILTDLGMHVANACCIVSSCHHGYMVFILNVLLKPYSSPFRSLFLTHSKLPVMSVRDLDMQGAQHCALREAGL